MTVETLSIPPWMSRTYTVEEYLALGEIEPDRVELVEGKIVMAASPRPRHSRAVLRLAAALDPAIPAGHVLLHDLDTDLRLVGPRGPGTVRRPDLLVVTDAAYQRAEEEGGIVRASDLLVAVEVASPGNRRTDHVAKRSEYADAGIPHYWIVDLDERVTLTTCHLGGEFGYVDSGPLSGRVAVSEPFAAEVDLDRLL